jgi:iron-sulfur cluster repair protein YtfE (RIC family)
MENVPGRISAGAGNLIRYEETVLLPYVCQKLQGKPETLSPDTQIRTLKHVKQKHAAIKSLLAEARTFFRNYTPAPGSPPAARLYYAHLFNFEQDMLKHLFIIESVLLPRLFKVRDPC